MKPREAQECEVRGSRVAVIGANGQLGSDLVQVFADWDLVPLMHADIEICDFVHTRDVLGRIKPDVVINTAAFVRVDDCEDEVSKAFWVNAFAVRNLAHVCADLGSTLVHISTDYVFDGKKREPYSEDDLPNPINVFGASKLAGEHFVQAICPKHLVVRSSGLYGRAGSSGKGGNFVETMIRLAEEGKPIRVVNDQVLAPTYTRDLAESIRDLLNREASGLFHVTNSGRCSWYEFAVAALAGRKQEVSIQPVTSAKYQTPARRPLFSILASARLQQLGLSNPRPWKEALADYLTERS
ncbi:MAG: dTDP-4-dehydrorhamnose reductase [Chloroflexi bacterium]|nr:dTDP-4-dehydrorhamnose reductase [Chloroflexota bacterium]